MKILGTILLLCFAAIVGCNREMTANASDYSSLAACLDAVAEHGKGTCIVDDQWAKKGGTNREIVEAVPHPHVRILDKRSGGNGIWEVRPGAHIKVGAQPATLGKPATEKTNKK